MELSSFEWMQKNDHLFDDHHMGERLAKLGRKGGGKGDGKGHGKGEGKGTGIKTSSKVGLQVGDNVNVCVSDETRELLIRKWQEYVTPITGHQTYKDMLKDFELAQIA